MKKFFLILMVIFSTITASAFEFDGINLNGKRSDITRAISSKGYVYDVESGCLKGTCQGTEIYLACNFSGSQLSQLAVEIPMEGKDAFADAAMIFNVIYHQVSSEQASDGTTVNTYAVSDDGTTMILSCVENGVKLTYNTPFYKEGKK